MMRSDLTPSPRMATFLEALHHADAIRLTAEADQAGKSVDYVAISKACWDALNVIANEPAGTIGDLQIKAKAFDWSARLLDGEPYHNPTEGEEKILRQLVAGLMEVSP